MLKIGHRGACGYEPENTIRSFKKAISLSVNAIEFDVQVSKDNKLVIIHDKKVNRTTNGRGSVSKKTLTELKQLDAGKGESIPTLDEAIAVINRGILINIELKGKGTADLTAKYIISQIKQYKRSFNDFTVSSFNHSELLKFKKLCPDVKIGMLFIGHPFLVLLLKSLYRSRVKLAHSINVSLKYVNKNLIDEVHNLGLNVYVYTVNDFEDFSRLKEWGVDGIFSDYPNRF